MNKDNNIIDIQKYKSIKEEKKRSKFKGDIDYKSIIKEIRDNKRSILREEMKNKK